MKKHVFDYRFTYRADYVRWRGTKNRPVYLTDVQPVELIEVDPGDAPVVYRIVVPHESHREVHEVRRIGGSLWWPVLNYGNPLEKSEFFSLAANDWERTSRVLDPMHRTYYLGAETLDDFLGRRRVSKGRFRSDREQQAAQAQRDASRIIFCEDRVFVEAGDPIWYAVFDRRARRFDLVIGHSELDRSHVDRPHGAGFFTPGPDRHARIDCGRSSLAFGLAEMPLALRTLADLSCEFRFGSEIVALSDHVPGPAAELCVRASAQHLREIAWMRPNLRNAMPELADRSRANARSDIRSDAELLGHFVSREHPALRIDHASEVAAARKALDRLAAQEPLAEQDEAALSALGI
jgi:hypothetical protein